MSGPPSDLPNATAPLLVRATGKPRLRSSRRQPDGPPQTDRKPHVVPHTKDDTRHQIPTRVGQVTDTSQHATIQSP